MPPSTPIPRASGVPSPSGSGATAAVLSVRDQGRGLPAHFSVDTRSLGMRIVRALTVQDDAVLAVIQHNPGCEFVIEFPLEPAATPPSEGTRGPS